MVVSRNGFRNTLGKGAGVKSLVGSYPTTTGTLNSSFYVACLETSLAWLIAVTILFKNRVKDQHIKTLREQAYKLGLVLVTKPIEP